MLPSGLEQVAHQPGMECQALTLEPDTRFFTSPVVVLDFRSLYPSLIIAYNMCFSTCLGRVPNEQDITQDGPDGTPGYRRVLGCSEIDVSMETIKRLQAENKLWVSPNGIMFAKKSAKPGILPRMLNEILQTRIMVKKQMKNEEVRKDHSLFRSLNARQFGLKMIANVTYGYTSASFTGRMPCAEIAGRLQCCSVPTSVGFSYPETGVNITLTVQMLLCPLVDKLWSEPLTQSITTRIGMQKLFMATQIQFLCCYLVAPARRHFVLVRRYQMR